MKILLIEDSRILRDRLRTLLDAIPETVMVAEAGTKEDARRFLEQYRPEVVVLDLRLCSGDSRSVFECIKANYPETIVVALTNSNQPDCQDMNAQLKADYVFDKSRDIEAFIRLLEDLQKKVFAHFGNMARQTCGSPAAAGTSQS